MYGCEHLKMNMKRLEEVCTITGEVRRGEVLCDFDFENCPHYQTKPHKKENLGQTSIFDYENNS